MKRKTYRSKKINAVSLEAIQAKVEGHVLFGIDVGKKRMLGAVMGKDGEVVETIRWTHPLETPALVDLLKQLKPSAVVLEPTGTYGDALRTQIEVSGLPVFRVSPKHTHDMRELYDGVPSSHDGKSAAIVAELHRIGKSSQWEHKSASQREIRAAMETLDIFQEQHQRLLGMLEALLARHWPEVTEILSLERSSLAALLAEFGGPTQIGRRSEEAQRFLFDYGGGFLKEEKAIAVVKSAKNTLGVPMLMAEVVSLQTVANEALRMHRKALKHERELRRLVSACDESGILVSVIGPKAVAALVSLVGSPKDYPAAAAYLKGCGLNLWEVSSGQYRGRVHITKRGPGRVRKYLYMAVLRLIQSDPVFEAAYREKRARGKDAAVALVALMRKLLKGIWWCANKGEMFDSRKLFDLNHLSFGKPAAKEVEARA